MNNLKVQKVMDNKWITLDTKMPIWPHFFTVAPLVVIGTKEHDGYDLAPKHMATPVGLDNYFAFVCTPKHNTYHNAKREGAFTVSYPRPDQVVLASLAASPRCGKDSTSKPIVKLLPTVKATEVDGLFLEDSYLYLECLLVSVMDGFGENSIITGEIVKAHIHEEAYRDVDIDEGEMIHNSPLLAYLAPGRFAKISKSIAFPFPKDIDK